MKKKTNTSNERRKPRRPAKLNARKLLPLPDLNPSMAELYRKANVESKKRGKNSQSEVGGLILSADIKRVLHELEVHQIELEMQNSELKETRGRLENLLEKYTDLYDFAPVGYFTLDEQGKILEVNLTGAALLCVERSKLINQRLDRFLLSVSHTDWWAFLERVFAGKGKQALEAALTRVNEVDRWFSFHGAQSISLSDPLKSCRVAVSDISSLKQAEMAQQRLEETVKMNRELQMEIVRRKAVEDALKQSEKEQGRLLAESQRLQVYLRKLSHQILNAQEAERKRISRELHDVIAQTLTSISVRLTTLKRDATHNSQELDDNIASTHQLVEHAVQIVHQFARELRPAVLDDLGLIPALHTYLKEFAAQTGIHTNLTAFAGVEKLGIDERTVLFRVTQEALANVDKHAKANRTLILIEKLPGAVGLRIEDNGRGLGVKDEAHFRGNGLGLLGMRERVEMVDGNFSIESTTGKGTIISVRVPFPNKRAKGLVHRTH